MKYFVILLISLLCSGTIWGQTFKSDATEQVYQFYLHKDMASWKQLIDQMEAQPQLTQQQRWNLLNFEYGYVAWRLGDEKKDKQEAHEYLDKALAHLEVLEKDTTQLAVIKAYHAAFIGYQIAIHPIKAPFIGLKSKHFIKEAMELDSTSYFVHIQMGNIKYYMPEAFGGSKKEGIYHYQKAAQIMEEVGVHEHNWLYMNLILTLADAYKKQKDYDQVEKMYHWALQVEPAYSYVQEKLIPGLQNLRLKEQGN